MINTKAVSDIPGSGIFIMTILLFVFWFEPLKAQDRVEVLEVQDMSFGSFATGDTGGTIVISPNHNRIVTGTVTGLVSSFSAAVIRLRIQGNKMIVNINLPTSAQLVRSGGSETMTITNFISDRPGNSFVTTSGNATYDVKIGATLNVQNSQINKPGNYQGNFAVTFIRE